MRSRHFSLIELLAVMAIIAILTGLIVGVSGFAGRKGAVSRTLSLMSRMEIALEQYCADYGHYPLQASAGWISWTRGEFLDPQGVCYLEQYASPYTDAWHQEFYYDCPGSVNSSSYDIWSRGPDKKHGVSGVDDNTDGTTDNIADARAPAARKSDDISNWKQN